MLRRLLILFIALCTIVGSASAYERQLYIYEDELGGADGDPGGGDLTPSKTPEIVVEDQDTYTKGHLLYLSDVIFTRSTVVVFNYRLFNLESWFNEP